MNGSNGQTGARGGFEDLPYFQEYLQTILRPRIEKTIEALDRSLTEAAWRHIISTVAADQHLSPDAAAAIIRPLLEQKLGLRIQARLESQFAPPPTETSDGVSRTADGPEVMTVRRRPMMNPIANAVASNPRPVR